MFMLTDFLTSFFWAMVMFLNNIYVYIIFNIKPENLQAKLTSYNTKQVQYGDWVGIEDNFSHLNTSIVYSWFVVQISVH